MLQFLLMILNLTVSCCCDHILNKNVLVYISITLFLFLQNKIYHFNNHLHILNCFTILYFIVNTRKYIAALEKAAKTGSMYKYYM